MKCAHACKITKAACVEHQFFCKIKIDEKIKRPA